MSVDVNKYIYRWYRCRITFTHGMWRFGVTFDLCAFLVGLAFPNWRTLQIDAGFLSFDFCRLEKFVSF